MYETAVVSATEKCSLGAKIRKMSLQAYQYDISAHTSRIPGHRWTDYLAPVGTTGPTLLSTGVLGLQSEGWPRAGSAA